MSKGSKRRPVSDKKKFESEWDRIFKNKDKQKVKNESGKANS